MGIFEQFPYANFHELNADWLIKELLKLKTTVEEFVSINALKYADPIQWNITRQYEKNTIVIDPLTGTAYISVQPVPSGVALTRTEYWTVVFDLGSFVVRAAKNFTDKFEEDTTLTATFPSAVNDWLIWGDTLYRVISNIVAGDQYVVGSNIEHFTIEDVIGHIEDLTTADKSNIVAAVNEIVTNIGNLDDLTTSDTSNIVAAINTIVSSLNGIDGRLIIAEGNISNLQTQAGNETLDTISQSLSGAINEIYKYDSDTVTPEQFGAVGDGVNDDSVAIQAALDTDKNVKLSGTYLVTQDILIRHFAGGREDKRQLVVGGTIILHDCTIKGDNAINSGGVVFFNTFFTSDGNYTTPAFIVDQYLIRCKFILCKFKNIDYVFYTPTGQAYSQELNIIQCFFYSGVIAYYSDLGVFALKFIDCNFGAYSQSAIEFGVNSQVTSADIVRCTIENCGTGIKLNHIQRKVNIDNCHFESNSIAIDLRYLEVDTTGVTTNVIIQNNYLRLNEDDFIALPFKILHRPTYYQNGDVIPITFINNASFSPLPDAPNNRLYQIPNGTPNNQALDFLFIGVQPYELVDYMHHYELLTYRGTFTAAQNVPANGQATILTWADFLTAIGRSNVSEWCIAIRNGTYVIFSRASSGNILGLFPNGINSGESISYEIIYK